MSTTTTPGRLTVAPAVRRRLALTAILMTVAALGAAPAAAQEMDDTPPIFVPHPDDNVPLFFFGRDDGPFEGPTSGANSGAWTALLGPGCPASHPNGAGLFAMSTEGERTRSSGTFLGYGEAYDYEGTPITYAEAGIGMGDVVPPTWDQLEATPQFSAPNVYELLIFCSSATGAEVTDENSVPAASGWLSFNAESWTITAEEPGNTVPTQFDAFTATVDGAPVEDGTSFPEGSDVQIVAEIAPAEAVGTVEVHNGTEHSEDTLLGEATVSGGTATITLEDVQEGEYALTGAFVPDDLEAFGASRTVGAGVPLSIVAPDAVQTTTTLAVTPESPAEVGAEVILTATVEPGDVVGEVQFRVDGEPFQDPVAVSDGTATLTTSELTEGEHELRAAFLPEDSDAFTSSTSAPVTYAVGDARPQVTAVDADGNTLGENPVLQDGQVVRLTAPGFQPEEEEVTVTLDATGDEPEELGTTPADAEGVAGTVFTAENMAPGQHALDFAGAEQTLTWQFQLAGEGDENGDENGADENGTDEGDDDGTDGGDDNGTDDGSTGGTDRGTGNLAETGAFLVGPAVLLGIAAVSAGYAFVRRSRREELLTFDDSNPAA